MDNRKYTVLQIIATHGATPPTLCTNSVHRGSLKQTGGKGPQTMLRGLRISEWD
jgi:hypothetical protein